jgi:membrane protein YqaA with SNARE-associated domain
MVANFPDLLGLFLASFAAATLIPLPSEAALYAYLQAHPGSSALALAVATIGNTAGGMTTYLLGRVFPNKKKFDVKTEAALRKYGAAATVVAFLPIIGDALCAAAGWLRLNWLAVLLFMAAGRLARYLAVAFLAV